MGANSTIEWTEASWNPLTGCAHISEGCDNCYAAKESAGRLAGHAAYVGLTVKGAKPAKFTGEIRLLPDRLEQPLHWRTPRRIFVNSMSDLFHKDVPNEFIARVFAVMYHAPQHTYQVLTKRPQRMAKLLNDGWLQWYVNQELGYTAAYSQWPPRNFWPGVSIESDKYAWRADHLRAVVDAAVRFISAEPLLGPLPSLDLDRIDWLIVGGESGPGARPMHPDWVRDLRDRCQCRCCSGTADRPVVCDCGARPTSPAFFFKQWGEWGGLTRDQLSNPDAATFADNRTVKHWLDDDGNRVGLSFRVGKHEAGRLLDGREWSEYPL